MNKIIKKAMILAAGRGERMLPLSRDLPKPLFMVGCESLLQRHLSRLASAGIESVVINVHYLAEQIIEALGDEQFGMSIQYSHEVQLLETAGGIKAALPLLGDDPFLIVNGDVYTDFDFADLVQCHSHDRLPILVMVSNPEHHPQGDFAISSTGKLLNAASSTFTYSGIGIYQADFFSGVGSEATKLRPLFEKALQENRLFGQIFEGFWSDVGTPERYQELIDLIC